MQPRANPFHELNLPSTCLLSPLSALLLVLLLRAQVYERGIALFSYPHVADIWLLYLTQFTERYVCLRTSFSTSPSYLVHALGM